MIKLSDRRHPLLVEVKRGTVVYDGLNQPKKGAATIVASTNNATVQPVSSSTLLTEAGLETRTTHELYCDAGLDIKAGDSVSITWVNTGAQLHYTVNGEPKDWGSHLEVWLICQT